MYPNHYRKLEESEFYTKCPDSKMHKISSISLYSHNGAFYYFITVPDNYFDYEEGEE